jgi:hypothetical protein
MFVRAGFYERVPKSALYVRVHDAVVAMTDDRLDQSRARPLETSKDAIGSHAFSDLSIHLPQL